MGLSRANNTATGLGADVVGDFETGLWARSAVSALTSRRKPHLAGDCGVWHGKGFYSLDLY